MKRRHFIQGLSALGFTSLLPIPSMYTKSSSSKKLPKRLAKGDTVAIITPAGSIQEKTLEESIKNLETLGLQVKYKKEWVLGKYGYLGGTDEKRAMELNEAFADNEVDAIFCARGGYGTTRILDKIDYKLIRKNPKILIGYSDITALINVIHQKTGLVTFHSLNSSSSYDAYSVENLKKVLLNPSESCTLKNIKRTLEREKTPLYTPLTIKEGVSEGELLDGNLSLLASMVGTKYEVNLKGKLLFLEDVHEAPYRLDRMLTQLRMSGLNQVVGVALGVFAYCEKEEESTGFSLRETLTDRLGDLGVPLVYGLSFGHIKRKYTLPIGIKARLDTEKRTIMLLEKAVL